MKVRDLMVAMLGGAAIYVAVAACNGGETVGGASAATGETCECEAKKPQVDVVTCVEAENGESYATMEYPGASAADLSVVQTIVPRTLDGSILDGTWTRKEPGRVYIRDGAVMAVCAFNESNAVTFIRP